MKWDVNPNVNCGPTHPGSCTHRGHKTETLNLKYLTVLQQKHKPQLFVMKRPQLPSTNVC